MTVKKKYYFGALLLAVFIFLSNFLNTQIFGSDIVNFVVWFILSLFVFALGWIINNTLGWIHGGKIVFSVIVSMAVFSAILISFFSDYFLTENLLVENIILYSLRNILLGVMAFFGMALSELFSVQREVENLKNVDSEKIIADAKEKAELIIEKAKLESEKLIFDANKKATKVIDQKNVLEKKLKEFIEVEKEMIKKYESDN